MFQISEIAPHGPASGQSSTQQQVISSVMALHRVIAAQAGAKGGDAAAHNFSGGTARSKEFRNSARVKDRAETEPQPQAAETRPPDRSAEARSIVEAQEAAFMNRRIVSAFQARHGIADLLSVIRDTEDRMLPRLPAE